ncbi:MAG: VCBS repeat-containing protein [Phycisphaerales bacterium]|nr:VCBS repeat-containing protein [Phycisphaerales bacterium]
MSTFAYSDLASSVTQTEPSQFGAEYTLARRSFDSFTVVGDVDGDRADDVLVPNGPYIELLSGKTASVLRVYSALKAAALGDTDGDGTPDYVIDRDVYSGKSGSLRYALPEAVAIRAGGDIDHDGKADILVMRGPQDKVYEYSGADGTLIRTVDVIASSLDKGGVDFNGDGVPDFVTSPTIRRLVAYSGLDGATLFSVDHPNVGPSPYVFVDAGADFNQDGTPDVLVTINEYRDTHEEQHARAYSGVDGSQLYELPGVLYGPAGIIDDVNGDGVRDVASASRQPTPTGFQRAVSLHSGTDGHVITFLSATGPALVVQTGSHRSEAMGLSGPFTSADLNGDGLRDVCGRGEFYIPGYADPEYTTHYLYYDGARLGSPVFTHVDPVNAGSVTAWGRLGATDFVISQGRTVFLTDLGFAVNDRVVHFSAFGQQVLLVVAPGGDQTNPLAWYAARDFTGPRTYVIKDATRITGPAGVYTIERVVDADGGQVLVQMMRDGTTPATFIFERTPAGSPSDPGRLAFRFDGRPTAIYAERVVGLSNDDPGAGVLWDFAQPVLIPGLRPVGLYLEDDGTSLPPVIVVGVAQRDGDAFGKVYRYNSETGVFSVAPLIEGGTEWSPVEVDSAGGIAGTFRRGSGAISIFLTRILPGAEPTEETEDVLGATLIGAPAGLAGATPRVIGLGPPAQDSASFDVYLSSDDAGAGLAQAAALSDIAGPGPFNSPSGAAFSLSQDGSVLATRNLAGQVLFFQRSDVAGGGETWRAVDTSSALRDALGQPVYDTPHFGPIITWTQPGWTNPFIALGTDAGLILLEPIVNTVGGSGPPTPPLIERYEARNLTTLTAGAAPITQGLTTFLPRTGLRIIAGLTADGDLAMYGMTGTLEHLPGYATAWAYANLFDQIFRPTGLPEPRFDVAADGDLISYVTAWGGLNIAGVDADTGDVVVFWHAPGLSGWRYSNLDDSLADPSAASGVSHLSVYLTSWGGINIVGGAQLGVYWWAPGLGGQWQFSELTDAATGGPPLIAETVTSYVTPWDGLNVAGLDQAGRLWVYWWTPTVYWTAETIDAALPDLDAAVERTGPLRSAVSDAGRISIYARSAYGNPLRYSWAPGLAWSLTDLNSVATYS